MLGEASAEGRFLLYFVEIVVFLNVCVRCVLRNYVVLLSVA